MILEKGVLFININPQNNIGIKTYYNYDENLYDDPEYQIFLNLEKNFKKKKILNKFIYL